MRIISTLSDAYWRFEYILDNIQSAQVKYFRGLQYIHNFALQLLLIEPSEKTYPDTEDTRNLQDPSLLERNSISLCFNVNFRMINKDPTGKY